LPSTKTARQEAVWQELRELERIISTVGPVDPGTRGFIRTRAAAVATVFQLQKPRDFTDHAQLIQAHELLRDVGIETPFTSQNINVLLRHAQAAVEFFLQIRDHLNLGRALMAWGNIYRLLGDEANASPLFTAAFNVINEGCYRGEPRNNTVAWYLHQAGCWRLRTRGRSMGLGERRAEMQMLTRLAEQVDDPRIWVDHYREVAGFDCYLLANRHAAIEHLRALTDARRKAADYTHYADPTLLTPKIELLFESGRQEEAIELIRGDYFKLYVNHRHTYYHRQLSRWSKENRFSLPSELPAPDYGSAFLSYLARPRLD
jgi:tetratricopeptide (TPR) repeat protein